MKITLLYDNTAFDKNFTADWGFSCLIEVNYIRILFDTGARGSILLENMKRLGLDPATINEVFISHDHWDHTGGLADFLDINPAKVYLPGSCGNNYPASETVRMEGSGEIHKNIFSTGVLAYIEQSLVLNTEKGSVVVVGCSHPGVDNILKTASQFGKPMAIIGGLHDFNQYEIIEDLQLVCPTHCTQHIREIKSLYPDKYLRGGAGQVIDI